MYTGRGAGEGGGCGGGPGGRARRGEGGPARPIRGLPAAVGRRARGAHRGGGSVRARDTRMAFLCGPPIRRMHFLYGPPIRHFHIPHACRYVSAVGLGRAHAGAAEAVAAWQVRAHGEMHSCVRARCDLCICRMRAPRHVAGAARGQGAARASAGCTAAGAVAWRYAFAYAVVCISECARARNGRRRGGSWTICRCACRYAFPMRDPLD